GNNYGWPLVSNGRNYSGTDIPDHDTRPDLTAPKVTWTPVISPSSLSIYSAGTHNDFPAWQGNALISGLSSKALIIVSFDDSNSASERYRYDM
ncbi:PQQ-dependent sugar dehydrogenase, partial [Pseudomonas sp. HY7a-MNA-CIBAN-0227]